MALQVYRIRGGEGHARGAARPQSKFQAVNERARAAEREGCLVIVCPETSNPSVIKFQANNDDRMRFAFVVSNSGYSG